MKVYVSGETNYPGGAQPVAMGVSGLGPTRQISPPLSVPLRARFINLDLLAASNFCLLGQTYVCGQPVLFMRTFRPFVSVVPTLLSGLFLSPSLSLCVHV